MSLTLGGCLQSTSLVKLNADGSGTIEQRTTMTTAALTSLRQLAGAFAKPGDNPLEPFSEADARRAAGEIGDGVTLVSSEPISTPDGEGRVAVYAFRDITKIHLNNAQRAAGSGGINTHDSLFAKDNTTDFTIDFTRTRDGNALVTVHMSGQRMESMLKERGLDRKKEVKPSDIAMVKQMFAGMRMAVQVQPAGLVVRTNSPYLDDRTVTLFELDLDELLKNDAVLPRLQQASTPDEISTALKDVRGLKMALDNDVTIEFTPAR
jgi:hypothetical protein